MPADLDLVVRIDVMRLRAAIGPGVADELARHTLRDVGEVELKEALSCAEVVWVAARAAALETGDHVVVVQGRDCLPELARSRWTRVRATNGAIAVYDRTGEAPRGGTARIIDMGYRAVAFVSPVELDSVQRVLDKGPDDRRGNPLAEGIVSFDLRVHRLPPALERKYPSIAAVVAGVDRVRASTVMGPDGLKVDGQVVATSPVDAERAARFLSAVRENLEHTRYAEAAKVAEVKVVESSVRLGLVMPTKVLVGLLVGSLGKPE